MKKPDEINTINMIHVCQVLSAQYGVKIEVNGTDAYVAYDNNGNATITIPALCVDDPEYITKVRGFLDHEVGHVRFTNTAAVKTAKEAHKPDYSKHHDFIDNVSNIFEDVYVERKMGEAFPGCAVNLKELVGVVFEKQDKAAFRGYTQFDYIVCALLYATRAAAQPDYTAMFDKHLEFLAGKMDASLLDLCREFARKAVDTCNSTADNWELSFELLDRVKDLVAKKRQDQSQGQEQEQEQEQEQGQSQGQEQPQSQGQSQVRMTEGELAQMENMIRHGIANIVRTGSEIQDSLNADTQKEERRNRGNANTTHKMKESPTKGFEFAPVRNIAGAMSVASALSARLSGLLQTKTITRGNVSTRGSLDYNKLHRLSVCNARVFRSKTEKSKLNTEVIIAVDNSTSMLVDNKNIVTGEALYGLLACLKRLPDVAVEAFGFGGNTISPLLGKNEPLSPYTKLHPMGNGGTICGSATTYALSRFDMARDTRKLYFILTDGETSDKNIFATVLRQMRGFGIEIIGIGIKDQHLGDYLYLSECRIINDLSELPEAMFSLLEKKLVA